MARLLYSAICSLDGFVADEAGEFGWAAPDEEVHAFVNDVVRGAGTHLYGRRMYEVLAAWETSGLDGAEPPAIQDFAKLWRGADKVVYSSTLERAASARTRIERRFEPEAVRALKARARTDLTIGGPQLAAHAFRAGLVDECHLFLTPVLVGAGTHALPEGVRADLELLDSRRFRSGVVHLHHRVRT